MSLLWLVVVLTLGGYLALAGVVCLILYTGTKRRVVGDGLREPGARRVQDADEVGDMIA